MQIVDSHCHIDRVDLNAFGGSIESMLKHAGDLSVTKFLCVCIDLEHFDEVHNLVKILPQHLLFRWCSSNRGRWQRPVCRRAPRVCQK